MPDQSELIALRMVKPIHEGGTGSPYPDVALANLGGVAIADQPYDIPGFTAGKPKASELDVALIAPRALKLPANLAGSLAATATNGATTTATFLVAKNGATVATFTFAASGQAGPQSATFSTQAAVPFAIGDVLTVTAPSIQDATLSDVRFTLVAKLG